MKLKRKASSIVILMTAFIFLFTSIAGAAPPRTVYYENEPGQFVKADFEQAMIELEAGNSAMYSALEKALRNAQDTGGNISVELDDGNVIDWAKALTDSIGFPDAQTSEYFTTAPQAVKELKKDGNIGDPVAELQVVSISAIDANTLTVVLSDETTHEVTLETALEANAEIEVTFEIDGKEYTATVTWVVEEEGLKVVEVSAINATTIEATLAEAKADATKDDFNVTVGDEVVAVTAVTANIDNTVYTLNVDLAGKEGILKVNGTAVEAAIDFKKPAIVNAVAKSATVIEVEFSEKVKVAPAQTIGNYTLRYAVGMPATYVLNAAAADGNVQANAVLLADGKTVRISIISVGKDCTAGFLNSGLRNGEPYQIKASANVVDLANNGADTTYASFTGTNLADATAPVVTGASYTASTGALKLTFDKAVKLWDATSAADFDLSKVTLTATGKDPVTISAGDVATFDPVAAASVTGSTITFNVAAAKGAQINALGSSFAVNYQAGAFVDVAGNEIQAGSTAVTLTQGLQVTGASYNEETRILTLNFNNVIDVSKIPANYNGIKIAGVAIGTDAALQNTSNSNTIQIKLSEAVANATKTADRANAVNGKAEVAKDATDGVTVFIPDNTFTDVDAQKLTTIGNAGTTLKNITFTEDATAPTIQSVSVTGLAADAGTLTIKFSEKVRSKIAATADFDKTKIKFYTTDSLTAPITDGTLTNLTKLATATVAASNDQVFTDTWKIDLAATGDMSDAKLAAALNKAIVTDKKTVVMSVDADAAITDVNGVKIAAVAPADGVAVTTITSEQKPNLFKLSATGAKVLFFQSGWITDPTSKAYADATEIPKFDTALSNDKTKYALVPTLGGAPVEISSVSTSNTGVKATNGVYVYTSTALVTGVEYTLTVTGLKTETGLAIEATANSGKVTLAVDGVAPVTNTKLTAAIVAKDNDNSGTFTAGDTLTLDFGTPIHLATGAKATDITVEKGTAPAAGTFGSAGLAVDGNKLVITLAANSVVAVGNTLDMKVDASKILNADDQKVIIDGTSGYNAVVKPVITAPTVKTAVFNDANANGALDKGDTIVVTFTGKVSAAPAADLTDDFVFVTAGATLSKVELAADGMSATLTLDAVDNLVPGTTTINLAGGTDLDGLWSTDAVAAAQAIVIAKSDTTQPTVLGAKLVTKEDASRVIVFQMSEKVHVIDADKTFDDNFIVVQKDGQDSAKITGTLALVPNSEDATQVMVELGGTDVVVPGVSQVKVILANENGIADANGNYMKFDNQAITIAE